jgi:hypothetical protein
VTSCGVALELDNNGITESGGDVGIVVGLSESPSLGGRCRAETSSRERDKGDEKKELHGFNVYPGRIVGY